jgi:hypothetical protein
MNKGFSKLEVILLGVILVVIISFIGTKSLPLLNQTQNNLERRYNEFASLEDKRDYSEAYNFYSTSVKNKATLDGYINSRKSQDIENRLATHITINKVVIKDNVGYIDQTSTRCEDNDCKSKIERRVYRRWIFENGNWYYSPPDPRCIRTEMYDMPPEFQRALSLVKQRLTDRMGEKNIGDFSFLNCLDIQYSSLDNAEGLFTFDKKSSSLEKLTIYVDNSYKIKDDILTAFLLSHEVFHASQYLNRLNTGSALGCYAEEIQAFWWQSQFLASLNRSEIDSVTTRIVSTDYSNNNPLILMKTFADFSGNAMQACGADQDCVAQRFTDQITFMVKNSPFYQKECGSN